MLLPHPFSLRSKLTAKALFMSTFTELTLILAIAAAIAALMRLLKQPLIMGYIITGLLVGPSLFNLIKFQETLNIFSQLGIAFLLFIVGLNLSPRVIREVGKISVIAGLGQVIFTTSLGFLITYFLFGFSFLASVYLSLALTFSSTIIVLKLLSDKHDLQKLYGKISIGFLLVQDVIVAFIFIVASSWQQGVGSTGIKTLIIITALKGVFLITALTIVSIYILPRLSNFFARSQEVLFLFSLAWGLGLAVLFYRLGFSIEIGALAAGVALSLSPYSYEVSAKMRPLRDFFIILFFIMLGSQMVLSNLGGLVWPAVGLSFFVLIGNPLIVIILMGLLGYSKKTSFLAGLTVAQVSEFSLILIMMAVNFGHLSKEILSLITLVSLITFAGSTYLILHAERIYPYLAGFLSIFERSGLNVRSTRLKKYQALLFGYNRIGYDFLRVFNKLNKRFLVIDFDPNIIKQLHRQKINCRYGDAQDSEFLDELSLSNIKMAVSTMPDFETNLFLIEKIRSINSKAVIMVISHNIREAEDLYKHGASYVLLPHFLGGRHASLLIRRYGFSAKEFARIRARHLKHLQKRKFLGHEHPKILANL
jgi:Kef-type K+ transport system membrane component KefB